ncbi:MAG: 23S rRNA (uracil(1939)-C(5))-methyltransferase RlmD [Candidatus Zixiibacteriota bacterium]
MSKKLIEIEISDLSYNGQAVGNIDGKVVFLNGGLPGEIVLAEIKRNKPRFNVAEVKEIIKKSDRRIPAVCSHFEYCGGCTWQDLTYSDQLIFKKKQVKDCIERIGGLSDVKIDNVTGSVDMFQYRNKMEFSFNVSESDGFNLGMHRRGAFNEIFNLEKCYLTENIVSEIVKWMRDYITKEKIPVYDVMHHTGYMRFLMIRQAKHTSDLMVNVITNYGEFPSRERFIKDITKAFPQISTIVHNQNGQKSNIATGEIEQVMYGSGYIEEHLLNYVFRIRANSFFQTNSIQSETLYRYGFEMLKPKKDNRVLDLYCGTGTIGILCSQYVEEVVGVELVPDAVKAARENARQNKVNNISFVEGFVKDFLKNINDAKNQFDIVIIDPPRAGMHPKALKQLLLLNPKKILYISCNPATFARDAKILVDNNYRLPEIKPVDMFPHTMHIELLSVFCLS